MESGYEEANVTRVKSADPRELTFDGKKADIYLNTGRLGGQHFLVSVKDARGEPTLIAIHL